MGTNAVLNLLLDTRPCLEVIKLEYSIQVKIKRNDWLLADTCPQAAIIGLYFEIESELKFYNLKARYYLILIILTTALKKTKHLLLYKY